MNHLYKNTPFDQFQESWLSELNEEFLAWLDHVALYVSQKREITDSFCGYGAPSNNEFNVFANICHMAVLGKFEKKVNLIAAIAAHVNPKGKETVNAWLGFLHGLLREHDDAAQTKKVIEAIYCICAAACGRG